MEGIMTSEALYTPFLAAGESGDLAVLWVPGLILLAICSFVLHFHRSRTVLERWAAENCFEILESDYRSLCRGPFFWTSSEEQTVYKVKVRDREGVGRSGWVRCGRWFVGLWSDRVEVKWDD
jgi:hypothetical protein